MPQPRPPSTPAPKIPPPPATPTVVIETVTETAPIVSALGSQPAPATITVHADLRRQYVSGGGAGFGFVQQYARTLPAWIDPLTRDFGRDLYYRMRGHPIVESALAVRRGAIVQQGCLAQPNLNKDDADYDVSERIATFVQDNLNHLDRPLIAIISEMLLSMAYGHKVAELCWELGPPTDPTIPHEQLFMNSIRPKPLEATLFCVDTFMEVIGLTYLRPGQPMPTIPQLQAAWPTPLDGGNPDDPILVSPEKFWIETWDEENRDPRGHSLLASGHFSWWASVQIWHAYLSYLARFAEPSIAGFTDPEAQPEETDDGSVPATPEEAMLVQIVKMAGGASGAFPGGARIEVVESHGDGAAFRLALHETSSDITRATLGQSLMTESGDHMTRAASSVHQDVFGILVRIDKARLAASIERQIFRRIVSYNYGPEAARRYCPKASLGQADHQDFASYASAVAGLVTAGFFNDDQFLGLDDLLNVPRRDPTLWADRIALEQAALLQPAAAPGASGTPGPEAPSGSGGGSKAAGGAGSALSADVLKLDTRGVAKLGARRLAGRMGSRGP